MTDLKQNLFDWLVEYHKDINLKKCADHVYYGRVLVRGKPLQEGFDENELYKGVLIVANGDTLVDRLKEDKVIVDEIYDDFVKINNKEDFFKYLLSQKNSDGAYIFDSVNNRIVRVPHINNNPNTLPKNFNTLDYLPDDFVSYKGDVHKRNIGTKTRLAVMMPHAYPNVETFQIKRTAYTDLGIGKVTHFDKNGLVQEFFFKYDIAEKSILPINRVYLKNHEGKRTRVFEKVGEPIKEYRGPDFLFLFNSKDKEKQTYEINVF